VGTGLSFWPKPLSFGDALLVNIEAEWTPSKRSQRLNGWSFLLQTEGMMICMRTVRGFGCGNGMASDPREKNHGWN